MDLTWQQAWPRQERRPSPTTISPLALGRASGRGRGSLGVLQLMCRARSRLPGVRRRCIHSDKRLAPFSAPPTSLLSWGPVNVAHPWKWHIKEWSAKAFRQKSLAQGCSLLNKMETLRGEVHLLSVLAETQALTLGIMCLIIYMGLSANNAWFSHWSTFCHLWKSWQEAPAVFLSLSLFFFFLFFLGIRGATGVCFFFFYLEEPCPLTVTGCICAAAARHLQPNPPPPRPLPHLPLPRLLSAAVVETPGKLAAFRRAG